MNTSFAELGLNEHILEGVAALGFTEPTPVQAQAIPQVLAGRDVIASAQTGTGKTAAFALPLLQVIEPYSREARAKQAAELAADVIAAERAEAAMEADDAPTGEEGPAADGPDVVADDVPDGSSLSADVNPDGTIRRPKRPRRHHRRAADGEASAPEAEASKAAAEAGEATAGEADKPAAKPKPRVAARPKARKHKAKPASADKAEGEAGASQASPAPKANPDQDAPTRPKRRRGRKRRPAAEGASRAEDLAPNPNAHPFGPFGLVITPTRELAQQIEDVVSVVCEHTGQEAVVVMGGARLERQIRELERGCDLLVATPGRLLDLMEHGHVSLDSVKVFVLDEADRMLDMGFWPSVRKIVAALPKERQTLLFSATIPPSIKGTVDNMLHDPATIEIARIGQTADTVEEHLCPVTQGQKIQLLEALLRTGGADDHLPERVLVFCRTKHRVDDLEKYLKKAGVRVDVMHADRPQKAREHALEAFREGKVQVLVATDVMSRGIDVSGIDAVVNFDVPMDPEDYVHRIGRTGRAGATGHAYTFMAPDEVSQLREVEYFTKKLVPVWDLEGFDYDASRIVPNPERSTKRASRTMFSGSRSRGRGMSAGRYGRHY